MAARGITRDRVRALLEDGLSRSEVAAELCVSRPTITYHATRLGYPVQRQRRHDWAQIQVYYDEGNGVRACRTRFGFSIGAWNDAVKRGAIRPRLAAMPLEELLIVGPRNRRNLKQRLLRAGLKTYHCERCGLGDWRGRPLALELHHLNGETHDNRVENLSLLCPNCHSQTPSWGGRNARPAARRQAELGSTAE